MGRALARTVHAAEDCSHKRGVPQVGMFVGITKPRDL